MRWATASAMSKGAHPFHARGHNKPSPRGVARCDGTGTFWDGTQRARTWGILAEMPYSSKFFLFQTHRALALKKQSSLVLVPDASSLVRLFIHYADEARRSMASGRRPPDRSLQITIIHQQGAQEIPQPPRPPGHVKVSRGTRSRSQMPFCFFCRRAWGL